MPICALCDREAPRNGHVCVACHGVAPEAWRVGDPLPPGIEIVEDRRPGPGVERRLVVKLPGPTPTKKAVGVAVSLLPLVLGALVALLSAPNHAPPRRSGRAPAPRAASHDVPAASFLPYCVLMSAFSALIFGLQWRRRRLTLGAGVLACVPTRTLGPPPEVELADLERLGAFRVDFDPRELGARYTISARLRDGSWCLLADRIRGERCAAAAVGLVRAALAPNGAP